MLGKTSSNLKAECLKALKHVLSEFLLRFHLTSLTIKLCINSLGFQELFNLMKELYTFNDDIYIWQHSILKQWKQNINRT